MTTKERAMQMAAEFHCRYCSWIGPDKHPAMKCNGDLVDAADEIHTLLDLLVEARAALVGTYAEDFHHPLIERIDKALGEGSDEGRGFCSTGLGES